MDLWTIFPLILAVKMYQNWLDKIVELSTGTAIKPNLSKGKTRSSGLPTTYSEEKQPNWRESRLTNALSPRTHTELYKSKQFL